MRLRHPRLGDFEGTPSEIAEVLATLRRDGTILSESTEQPPHAELTPPMDVESARPLVTIAARPAEVSRVTQRLADPPTNELLVYQYRHAHGVSKATRTRYVAAVEAFERFVSPLSLLDVTRAHVLDWTQSLEDTCRHLKRFAMSPTGESTTPRVRCQKGLYEWVLSQPASCNLDCPMWARQSEGPAMRLKGLSHFYAWACERYTDLRNPVPPAKRPRKSPGNKKACPSCDEVRTILQALRRAGNLRDVAIVLALAKWGRRPSHTLLLDAGDLRGVLPVEGGVPHADFNRVRDQMLAINRDGETKLHANLYSPIDPEYLRFLREEYLPWRQERWGYAWNEGPLFPGEHGGRYRYDGIQPAILDRVLTYLERVANTPRERDHWRARRAGEARVRITAGSFRHFFTTSLEDFGLEARDVATLRGDDVQLSATPYRHMTPERVHAKYRMHELLVPPAGGLAYV